MVAKSIAKHYSQQNTKTETREALNRKTKAKHHTKQNNKTLNTLTQHKNLKQLHIKHKSLAIMNHWTLLPGNGAKFD